MSNLSLELAAIYCVVFSRGDGTFHWSICVAEDDRNAAKMHATNRRGAWEYENTRHNIIESGTACAAVKIGQLASPAAIVNVSSLLERIPMSIPAIDQPLERSFTCRVWVRQAVRVLAANGIISCSDIAALEHEIKTYGEGQDPQTIQGWGMIIRKSRVALM